MKKESKKRQSFPIYYKIESRQIIIYMSDSSTKVIPYTTLNEKNILKEIEKSLSEKKAYFKDIKQICFLLYIVETIFLPIFSLLLKSNPLDYPLIYLMIYMVFSSTIYYVAQMDYCKYKHIIEQMESFLESKKYTFNYTKEKEETLNNKQTLKSNKAIYIEKLKTMKNELISLFHKDSLDTEKDNMLVKK